MSFQFHYRLRSQLPRVRLLQPQLELVFLHRAQLHSRVGFEVVAQCDVHQTRPISHHWVLQLPPDYLGFLQGDQLKQSPFQQSDSDHESRVLPEQLQRRSGKFPVGHLAKPRSEQSARVIVQLIDEGLDQECLWLQRADPLRA